MQNELLSLKQTTEQNATDFAETIRSKLKKLTDKISELYEDNEDVKHSFYTEHEKMAVRAFKEGLIPPLKYRVLNSNETSFEKLRHFALEEEPFTKKSSVNTSANTQNSQNQPNPQSNFRNKNQTNEMQETNSQNKFIPRSFNNQNQQFQNLYKPNQNNPFNQQPRQFSNNFNSETRQFSNNFNQQPRQFPNNFNQQPRRSYNNNNQQPRQFPSSFNQPNRQFHNNNFQNNQRPNFQYTTNNEHSNAIRNTIECSRCGKKGHSQETCYVKLEKIDQPINLPHNNTATLNPFNQNPKIGFQQEKHENPFNRKISITRVSSKNRLLDEEFGLPVQTSNIHQ